MLLLTSLINHSNCYLTEYDVRDHIIPFFFFFFIVWLVGFFDFQEYSLTVCSWLMFKIKTHSAVAKDLSIYQIHFDVFVRQNMGIMWSLIRVVLSNNTCCDLSDKLKMTL